MRFHFCSPPSQEGHVLLHVTWPLHTVVHSRVECTDAGSVVSWRDSSSVSKISSHPSRHPSCISWPVSLSGFRGTSLSPQPHPTTPLAIISAPRSRWQLATAAYCRQVCAHRVRGQGGHWATEAGFLRCYMGSSPLCHTAASLKVLPPPTKQVV